MGRLTSGPLPAGYDGAFLVIVDEDTAAVYGWLGDEWQSVGLRVPTWLDRAAMLDAYPAGCECFEWALGGSERLRNE